MAKKKSFGIGSSLSQALTDTVSAASNYSGDLHVEVIPLRKIELDPDNPRDLVLNSSDLSQDIPQSDPDHDRKVKEKATLESIANSIKEQGIINPILVYKFGDNYRLIAGERRTLGSILAGKADIPAKILSEKPTALKLSLLQWIENMEREDLSLWERMCNLEKIIKAFLSKDGKGATEISATDLCQLISCSLQQAVNYKNVLSASDKLRELIKSNQIMNIEKAGLIAKAPSQKQDELIEMCLEGATLKELKAALSNTKKSSHLTDKRGRLSTRVNFGSTTNIQVAKTLIQSLLTHDKYSYLRREVGEIIWDDYKAVTKAFQTVLKSLEKAAS